MRTARTFNGLSTQIFLWFWFMLLLVVAAVVILPTLILATSFRCRPTRSPASTTT